MSNVIEFILEAKDEFSSVMQGFQLEMDKADKVMAKLAITGAIYAAGRAVKASLDNAEAMGVMAAKANMSTESFSALNYAASQSDVETGSLTTGLKMLGKAMGDTGASPAADQLKAMGVATHDAAGELRPTINVLMDISDQFATSKDNAAKTAAAMALFGRSGVEMVPLLNQGSDSIKEMMGNAEKLGIVIGTDFDKSANQINDNLSTLSQMISGTMNEAMKQLAPTIEQVTGDLILFGTEGSGIASIGEIIATAFKGVLTVVTAVSVSLGIVGKLLGATFAAVAASASGNFSEAGNIIKSVMTDSAESVDHAQTSIAAMWDGTSTSAAASAAQQQAAARKIAEALQTTSEAAKKAEEAAKKKAEEDAKSVDKTIEALEREIDVMKEGENYAKLMELVKHNATETQLEYTASVMDTADALKQETDMVKSVADLNNKLIEQSTQMGATADTAEYMKLKTQGNADAQLELAAAMIAANRANKEYNADMDAAANIIKGQETPYQQHLDKLKEINDARAGFASNSEFEAALQRENDLWERNKLSTQEYKDGVTSAMADLGATMQVHLESLGSTAYQIGQVMYSASLTMMKGVGDAAASALVDGKSLGAGLEAVLKSALKSILSSLIQIGIQKMIMSSIFKATTASDASAAMGSQMGQVYLNSFASAAAIPVIGWAMAPEVAAANLAIASTVTPVAIGAGAAMGGVSGVAHGGLDYVPAESTFLLDKGERVLSPRQNTDLTNYLANAQGSSSTSTSAAGGTIVIENMTFHIMENATNVDAFARMDKIQLRNTLGQPVIDVLNEMFSIGVRPDFAGQLR